MTKYFFITFIISVFLLTGIDLGFSGMQKVGYGGGVETSTLSNGSPMEIQYSSIISSGRQYGFPTFAKKQLLNSMSDIYGGKPPRDTWSINWINLWINGFWIFLASGVIGVLTAYLMKKRDVKRQNERATRTTT